MLFGEDYIVITELAIHKSFMVPTYVQNQGRTRKKIVKRTKKKQKTSTDYSSISTFTKLAIWRKNKTFQF
jgi:hypothetical protein